MARLVLTLDAGGYTVSASDTITRTCIVDGVEHDITPGHWTTTIRLGNADTRPFLTLDHATLGRLDSNRLAF